MKRVMGGVAVVRMAFGDDVPALRDTVGTQHAAQRSCKSPAVASGDRVVLVAGVIERVKVPQAIRVAQHRHHSLMSGSQDPVHSDRPESNSFPLTL